jgi:uncharacterized protein YjlB
MYVLETLKKTLEQVTGVGRSSGSLRRFLRHRKAHALKFEDDGSIPNNSRLTFIHYRSPVRLPPGHDPAAIFEDLFDSNGWKDSWRNGIYDFVHYHSSTHEVLGIARGHARVRFGGDRGRIIQLRAGDVVILPAGTGHQRISASHDLLVVGAYPPSGKYDECKGSRAEHERSLTLIAEVPLPAKDPVYGAHGPLFDSWKWLPRCGCTPETKTICRFGEVPAPTTEQVRRQVVLR